MTKNKGVALVLSVIILTAVLAIALTAGKIFTDKLKMSRNTSDSMKAYYAAESGIEYALYQIKQTPSWAPTANCSDLNQWTGVDGAKYCLEKTGDTIKAIGKAGETRRGIEVALAQAGTCQLVNTTATPETATNCPGGFLLVVGGCAVGTGCGGICDAYGYNSHPVDNGWFCRSHDTTKPVTAYAWCCQ